MDRRFVATLSLRLLGIYVLLQALQALGYFVPAIAQSLSSGGLGPEWLLGQLGALVALLVCGLVLLRWAPALAARWLGPEQPQAPAGELTPRALELIGYRLLGVYAVLTNAPSVLGQVGSYVGLASVTGYDFMTRDLLTALLGTLVGLWLVFGAAGLAALVDRLRGAGLQESEKVWKAP